MDLTPGDYEIDIPTAVDESMSRTVNLEHRFKSLDQISDSAEKEWEKNISEYHLTLSIIKQDLEALQIEFKKNVKLFMMMITIFKEKATNEELAKLEKKIERWNPESFVTRNEFKKIVRNYIEEEI